MDLGRSIQSSRVDRTPTPVGVSIGHKRPLTCIVKGGGGDVALAIDKMFVFKLRSPHPPFPFGNTGRYALPLERNKRRKKTNAPIFQSRGLRGPKLSGPGPDLPVQNIYF